jgi:hypothetical protein
MLSPLKRAQSQLATPHRKPDHARYYKLNQLHNGLKEYDFTKDCETHKTRQMSEDHFFAKTTTFQHKSLNGGTKNRSTESRAARGQYMGAHFFDSLITDFQ